MRKHLNIEHQHHLDHVQQHHIETPQYLHIIIKTGRITPKYNIYLILARATCSRAFLTAACNSRHCAKQALCNSTLTATAIEMQIKSQVQYQMHILCNRSVYSALLDTTQNVKAEARTNSQLAPTSTTSTRQKQIV